MQNNVVAENVRQESERVCLYCANVNGFSLVLEKVAEALESFRELLSRISWVLERQRETLERSRWPLAMTFWPLDR